MKKSALRVIQIGKVKSFGFLCWTWPGVNFTNILGAAFTPIFLLQKERMNLNKNAVHKMLVKLTPAAEGASILSRSDSLNPSWLKTSLRTTLLNEPQVVILTRTFHHTWISNLKTSRHFWSVTSLMLISYLDEKHKNSKTKYSIFEKSHCFCNFYRRNVFWVKQIDFCNENKHNISQGKLDPGISHKTSNQKILGILHICSVCWIVLKFLCFLCSETLFRQKIRTELQLEEMKKIVSFSPSPFSVFTITFSPGKRKLLLQMVAKMLQQQFMQQQQQQQQQLQQHQKQNKIWKFSFYFTHTHTVFFCLYLLSCDCYDYWDTEKPVMSPAFLSS